jgi:hypothetical protein
MLLTFGQDGQLVTDIGQSTQDMSVAIDKAMNAVLDSGFSTEFLH